MAIPLRIMSLLCNTCIWCMFLLGNHFSKLSPSEWNTTMSSNISNNKKGNDHSFTSMVPNSTSARIHVPSLSLLSINTSNGLQWLQFFLAFFMSTFASWFHHPLVFTCFSCYDLRMKANHEPISQVLPSKILWQLITRNTINLKKRSCKNITWQHLPFASSKKQMSHHVKIAMYSYILVYKPSTKHKSTKHISSNNWLLSQAKACTTTWWFTTRIPQSHETIRHISLSSLETISTLPSWYNIYVTINRPHKPTTHACVNDQNSQVDNIHVNKAINQHKSFTLACLNTLKLLKIPLFTHTNSHACITILNSLTSTIIPLVCTST